MNEVPITPITQVPKPKKSYLVPAVIGMGILIIFLFTLLFIVPAPAPVPAQPTPTAPTPTIVVKTSAIATTSAFLTWSEHVASIAAILNGFSLTDETLTPPILDVDLDL